MNNNNPGLRQSARPVIRTTGASAGAWFWSILLGINVIFWPSMYVQGPHRLAVETTWYGFLGLTITLLAVAAKIPGPPNRTPHPSRPDLRETSEFQGIR